MPVSFWPNSYLLVPVWSTYTICVEILGSLRTIVAGEDLSAVTTLIGSESLLLDMRRLKAQNYDDHEDPEIRPAACASILSSGFFVGECFLADVPPEAMAAHLEQLRKLNASTQPYVYVSRVITFRGQYVHEKVISCFAWCNRTQSVIEYLVSREYNWNWDFRSRVRAIALQSGHGRAANESAAALIAMAERPARVSLDFDDLDRENEWDKKYSNIRAKWWEEDDRPYGVDSDEILTHEPTSTTEKPIVDDGDEGQGMCDTTLEQRVRLCSHMLEAEVYRGKVLYSPYEDDRYTLKSPPACRRQELLFTHREKKVIVPKWVIVCAATDVQSSQPAMYGISIGAKSDHFLISHSTVGNQNVISAHSEHFWP